ncbi:MAG: tryptophan-rich sensory protein [Clostridia bacterium]|nr:tryptophan-rich sensory protein [Clostridia bacterium]
MKTNKQKIISYVVIIASILLVAVLGSVFVNLGMDWFSSLETPSKFVPSFIIPIVWTVIYVIFAIVLCNWVSKENLLKRTLILLIINGILNVLWCLLFFTFNQTLWGLIAILLLLISAWLLVVDIYMQKPIYSLITIIYPVWVSIATTLNLALWILN